jgi:hypothetical protein
MKSILLLGLTLFATNSFADLSYVESEDMIACSQQFGILTEDEFGEGTGLLEKSVVQTEDGSVRVYELVQGDESRGFLKIDVEGDISQIDDAGNFLKACQ